MKNATIVVAACGFAASLASAQTALLREGDNIGPGDYTVSALQNVATGFVGPAYGVRATISDAINGRPDLSIVWGSFAGGSGATLRTEGVFGTVTQTSFESFWGMNDDGDIAYSPSCDDSSLGRTGLDSVWLGDLDVAIEGDPFLAQPGQFHRFASRPSVDGTGRPWWVGGITNVQFGSTQVRGFYRGTSPEVVIQGGGVVPGLPFVLAANGSGISFDYRVSASGDHYIIPANMASGSTSNDDVVIMDGTGLLVAGALVRESDMVPVAAGGRNTEAWQAFDFFGINDQGDWLMTGDTTAAAALDEFVMINGQMVLREGDPVSTPDGDGILINTISAAHMNEVGDWAVSWEVSTVVSNAEAILVNGNLVAMEGMNIDVTGDGVPDTGATLRDISGIANLAISPRVGGSVWVYFNGSVDTMGTSTTTDDIDVFYGVEVGVDAPCQADLSSSSDPNDPGYGVSDGNVDSSDFFYFLDQFVANNLAVADLSGSSDPNDPGYGVPDGLVDSADFFYFLDRFVEGCR